jgi:hypothetical protein
MTAAASSGILAACGQQATPAPATQAVTEAVKEAASVFSGDIGGKLTVWGWANPWLKATSELFKEEYPSVGSSSWICLAGHLKFAVASSAGTSAGCALHRWRSDAKLRQNGQPARYREPMKDHVKNFPQYKIDEALRTKRAGFSPCRGTSVPSACSTARYLQANDAVPPETWDGTSLDEAGQKGHYMMS